ncbi:MAG: AAA family ATPase [Myxococcota bacterium]
MGPPGTGKTLTASVLAGELHLPLMRVVFEGLMSRYLGETAAKLRIIFDSMEKIPGVYLFDEFDAIGSQRALQGDVGEIRRVLASFLQLLEQDSSTSLIVAATNNPQLLDPALFRRFDDAVEYSFPADIQIRDLIENRLSPYTTELQDITSLVDKSRGLSYAELASVCDDAAKEMVLSDALCITDQHMLKALAERQ